MAAVMRVTKAARVLRTTYSYLNTGPLELRPVNVPVFVTQPSGGGRHHQPMRAGGFVP